MPSMIFSVQMEIGEQYRDSSNGQQQQKGSKNQKRVGIEGTAGPHGLKEIIKLYICASKWQRCRRHRQEERATIPPNTGNLSRQFACL